MTDLLSGIVGAIEGVPADISQALNQAEQAAASVPSDLETWLSPVQKTIYPVVGPVQAAAQSTIGAIGDIPADISFFENAEIAAIKAAEAQASQIVTNAENAAKSTVSGTIGAISDAEAAVGGTAQAVQGTEDLGKIVIGGLILLGFIWVMSK
jgi:hypothetical protein